MRARVPFLAGASTVAVLVAAAVAGCTGSPIGREPAIEITELDGPFDPLGIRIVGLAPGAIVTLVAEAHIDWVSHRSLSRFHADSAGVVDLSRVVPTDGAWSRPDPMAPFWSLEPDGAPVAWPHFDEEHTVQFTVIGGVVENGDAAAGEELATAQVVRGLPEDSIVVETIADAGLPAVYAAPADLDERSHRPALLVMGGSDGGIQSARMAATQLAGLGYPALAVSLFGSPGQSDTLAELSIEPVLEAITWLRAQPGVDPDRVTAFGVSRGGELALWLAANHADLVHGAILPAGTGELWCGYPDYSRSAWTLEVFVEEAGRVDTGYDGHRRESFRVGCRRFLEGSHDGRHLHSATGSVHHAIGRNRGTGAEPHPPVGRPRNMANLPSACHLPWKMPSSRGSYNKL